MSLLSLKFPRNSPHTYSVALLLTFPFRSCSVSPPFCIFPHVSSSCLIFHVFTKNPRTREEKGKPRVTLKRQQKRMRVSQVISVQLYFSLRCPYRILFNTKGPINWDEK